MVRGARTHDCLTAAHGEGVCAGLTVSAPRRRFDGSTTVTGTPRPLPTTAYVAEGRLVYTYQPDGWPHGVLTGYVNEAGGFVLEHVVAFRPRTVLPLVRAGLAYAWERGWAFVIFHVPGRHPQRSGLCAVGRRLGFVEYAPSYWLARNPNPVIPEETYEQLGA